MRTREFLTLDEDDHEFVTQLSAGLGEDAARVLAYLLLRSEIESEPATKLELRIGTVLNRSAIASEIDRLETAGVVERTTIRDDGPGRPPTAWRPTVSLEDAPRRVYSHHASVLLERAARYRGRSTDGENGEPTGDELTLGLNWRPNGLHLPFYAAVSDRPDGSNSSLAIDHYDGSHRALAAVRSGAADVGVVGAATLLRARAAGESIVPIAVVYQRAMVVLYTVRERFGEPLTGVDQLCGRRVGMPTRSETGVLGKLFLRQVAPEGSVQIVDTGGEEQDALLSGAVDVATGSFSDPNRLERRDLTVDTLAVADHFPIYGPTLVVRERTLSVREDALERLLADVTAGWASAVLDPLPAANRVAERADSSTQQLVRTFETASREFGGDAVDEHGWGWQREETWEGLRTALEHGALLSNSESNGS